MADDGSCARSSHGHRCSEFNLLTAGWDAQANRVVSIRPSDWTGSGARTIRWIIRRWAAGPSRPHRPSRPRRSAAQKP